MSRYSKSDYINREMAADSIVIECDGVTLEQARQALKDCPSADVEPVRHGRWIKISPAGIYECSECGQIVITKDIDAYKRCHNCGARMDEEEQEDVPMEYFESGGK